MRTGHADWLDARFDGVGSILDWLDQWKGMPGGVSQDLDASTKKVVDVSWQGDAAGAFQTNWTKMKQAIDDLPGLTNEISRILETLYASLEVVQRNAESAADSARQSGISVDSMGMPTVLRQMQPGTQLDPPVIHYLQMLEQLKGSIVSARIDACNALGNLHTSLTGESGFDIPTTVTWAGIAAAFYTSASDVSSHWTDATRAAAKDWYSQAFDLEGDTSGTFAATADRSALKQLGKDWDTAENGVERGALADLPGVQAMGTDLSHFFGFLGEDASPALRGLGKVPVLGLALAGVSGFFDAQGYLAKGESLPEAIAEAGLKEGASLATGILVSGAVVSLAGPGASLLLVAGPEVLVGALAADGVGHFVEDMFNENWSSDMNKYGVVGGALYGTADSAWNAAQDVGADVQGTVTGAWDAVTSIHLPW